MFSQRKACGRCQQGFLLIHISLRQPNHRADQIQVFCLTRQRAELLLFRIATVGHELTRRFTQHLIGRLGAKVRPAALLEMRYERLVITWQGQMQHQATAQKGIRQDALLIGGQHNQGRDAADGDRLVVPKRRKLPGPEGFQQAIGDIAFSLINLIDENDPAVFLPCGVVLRTGGGGHRWLPGRFPYQRPTTVVRAAQNL